jgi:hypothetical protein
MEELEAMQKQAWERVVASVEEETHVEEVVRLEAEVSRLEADAKRASAEAEGRVAAVEAQLAGMMGDQEAAVGAARRQGAEEARAEALREADVMQLRLAEAEARAETANGRAETAAAGMAALERQLQQAHERCAEADEALCEARQRTKEGEAKLAMLHEAEEACVSLREQADRAEARAASQQARPTAAVRVDCAGSASVFETEGAQRTRAGRRQSW